jgi:sporulation protein YlmC with PRC-barrel domain
MKLTSLLISGVLAMSCGSMQAALPAAPRPELFQNQQSILELVGTEVWNNQNEKLGRVKFITADLENARLVEVVIGSGGFLGFGRKVTSVPPRALTLDNKRNVMLLNVTKARFDAAPAFNTSDEASFSDRSRVAAVIRYYGLQPWFFTEGQTVSKNAEILQLGHVKRTNNIINLPIKSTTGEYLGQVGSLMLDLPKGQIIHVVDETQAMDGSSSYIIQARALRYNASHNGLVLDKTFAQVKTEPHYKKMAGTRDSFEEEKFVNRKVQSDRGLHSKQNAQAGIVSHATSMPQGANFRDVEKTSQINQAIQAHPRLSAHAKNIEVVTLNAQTTLRGHVTSLADKLEIGKIAAKAGRQENVSNLLEVR